MTADRDNVVFLKFKTPNADEEGITFTACKRCKNKTFTLIYDRADDFPMVRCAACGNQVGRVGWTDEDEE